MKIPQVFTLIHENPSGFYIDPYLTLAQTIAQTGDKKKKAPRSGSLPNALFLSSSGTRD